MSGPFGSSQFMYKTGAAEEGQSLRFEDGDSPYLSWTPSSAGNRKTWTWSGWVKRGNINTSDNQTLFSASGGSAEDMIRFIGSGGGADHNKIGFYIYDGAYVAGNFTTSQVFRDTSAWYHIVWVWDTTNATSTDRIRLYVNGERVTAFDASSYPSLNADCGGINNAYQHEIGRQTNSTARVLDGYLANVTFIDGTALDPTSFGEYDDTLWKPKSDADIQSLTFGTNGFYLPFKQTTEAEGFSTVTYTGNGGTQSIEGVGFEPDLVWQKTRSSARSNYLQDSVRGVQKQLISDSTGAETSYTNGITSFDSNGFSVGGSSWANANGETKVAWCWDAGSGSAVSNTDGSITSSVKANTAKGFSIVSYTGGSSGTIGHGLGVAPSMIITKDRDSATQEWTVYHSSLSAGYTCFLQSTAASSSRPQDYTTTAPTSSVYSVGGGNPTSGLSDNYIAYCFAEVSGYSSFGSYSGTGATGNKITTGFKPAFVMVKSYDQTRNWIIWDNTRTPTNPADGHLHPNASVAEQTGSDEIQFDSDGFTFLSGDADSNTSGYNYIYMAFADTRDATFFGDTSGNGNNWTPNALNNTDVVPDSPVTGGNFAVMNPTDFALYLSEGNLKVSSSAGSGSIIARSTMLVPPNSGKWYFEGYSTVTSTNGHYIGVWCPTGLNAAISSGYYDDANFGVLSGHECVTYLSSGTIRNNSSSSTVTGLDDFNTAGDIVGVLLDMDAQTVQFYTNGTAQGSAQSLPNTTDPYGFFVAGHHSKGVIFNAGQDDSFAGLETPNGVSDESGTGVFSQSQGANGKAWNSGNLPAATITAPDEYFNTVLYTGTGATQSITGVGFQPDWTWVKRRAGVQEPSVTDSVRGVNAQLRPAATAAESAQTDALTSFDADGFTLGADATNRSYNYYTDAHVAWNWLAGNGTVSNTDGSITSTVSANQTAGFSVATYTGNGTGGATIGHGLSSAPKMVIVKRRDAADDWSCFHASLGGTKYIDLNSTNAAGTSIVVWNNTDPSSTVVTLGTSNRINGSSATYVAYSFAEVENYSKIGSYTGNGSTDGTFVHCGFRPAWVMVKRTDAGPSNWTIIDNKRDDANVADAVIYPHLSNAEGTQSATDMLSNGFKLRHSTSEQNGSGATYIFIAFAESPFSKSNAR